MKSRGFVNEGEPLTHGDQIHQIIPADAVALDARRLTEIGEMTR